MIDPNMFARGYCAEFALVLCELYGYKLVSFDELCGDGFSCSVHYAAKFDDKFIDVRGCRGADEIIASLWSCEKQDYIKRDGVSIRDLAPHELEGETEIVEEAKELAYKYIEQNKGFDKR